MRQRLAQARRQHAARGAAADDDVVCERLDAAAVTAGGGCGRGRGGCGGGEQRRGCTAEVDLQRVWSVGCERWGFHSWSTGTFWGGTFRGGTFWGVVPGPSAEQPGAAKWVCEGSGLI